MKTTEFTTRLWLLMVVAPCLLAQGQNAPAVAPRPNFVFIIGDDIIDSAVGRRNCANRNRMQNARMTDSDEIKNDCTSISTK